MKPGSKRWKQFMAKLYGIGASVVIIGALFKIEHWPFASALLTVGLTTEAIIFFFSAFEPPHQEPDWSLVYPELATGEGGPKGSITEQLDDMLGEAKIEPELIQSLGDGMRSLSTQARHMSDITDAAGATKDYSDSLRGASSKVNELSDSYVAASESIAGLANSADASKTAGEHLQKMNSNLSSLNNMYELQLQDMAKSREMSDGMQALIQNLNDSLEDTRKYKENISELASNLESLNTVYSNMLNAMGGGGQKS